MHSTLFLIFCLLPNLKRAELRDHFFGDIELTIWFNNKTVGSGYFSGSVMELDLFDLKFVGSTADIMRSHIPLGHVERNDETGDDEFQFRRSGVH